MSSSLLGLVDPSFRALSGRLQFTVRRREFNKDSLFESQHADTGVRVVTRNLRISLLPVFDSTLQGHFVHKKQPLPRTLQ